MGWVADLLKEIPPAARFKAELEAMEKEGIALKEENDSLKSELQALRNELSEHRSREGTLAKDAETILVFIAKNAYATAPQVAKTLGMSKSVTDMHLEDLETAKHIDALHLMGQESQYYLEQTGRRYLHAKG